jgi:hypothetical protein
MNVKSDVEARTGQRPVDDIVDQLLRDQDYLLAQELKQKTEELNQLFVQAQRQKLKVELDTNELTSRQGATVTWLEVKVLKEI